MSKGWKIFIVLFLVGIAILMIVLIYKANRDIQIVGMVRELDGVSFSALKGFKQTPFKVTDANPMQKLSFLNYEIWTNETAEKGFGITIYTTGSNTPIVSYLMSPGGTVTSYIGGIP